MFVHEYFNFSEVALKSAISAALKHGIRNPETETETETETE